MAPKHTAILMALFISASINTYSAHGSKKTEGTQQITAKDPIYHQVKEGDTFYRLSVKYGVSVEAIRAANPHIRTLAIPIGHMLRIPRSNNEVVNIQYKQANTARTATPSSKSRSANHVASDYHQKEDITTHNTKNSKHIANYSRYVDYIEGSQTEITSRSARSRSANQGKRKFIAYRPIAERVGYTVQAGETIQSLCAQYGLTEERLRLINNNSLPSELQPGQHITLEIRMLTTQENETDIGWDMEQWMNLPEAGDLDMFGNTADKATTGWDDHGRALEEEPLWTHTKPARAGYEWAHMIHQVVKGETLQKIAKKYNTTTTELLRLNNHQLDYGLKEGHNLIVALEEIPIKNYQQKLIASTPQIGPAGSFENTPREVVVNTPVKETNSAISSRSITAPSNNDRGINNVATSRAMPQSNNQEASKQEIIPSYHKNAVIATKVAADSRYGKHVAWHPTARKGSYIKITNPINGKVTFAKVVGQPNDGQSPIMVTEDVAKYLEVSNEKFEVLLEYND